MKKNFINVLAVALIAFGMASCGGKKAQENEATQEEAAAAAGGMSKSLLTEELKTETAQFLKDIPDFEVPYRITTGEVTIGVGNTNYMLPITMATGFTTPTQKARAFGIYFADYNTLRAANRSYSAEAAVLAGLATDLNITFLVDIVKQEAPTNATPEQYKAFFQQQEDQLITALADNNQIDIAVNIIGGVTAEYACLIANPTLVVKGDATTVGLSENMLRRLTILGEISSDLSTYYPEMKELGSTLSPLTEKTTSIQTARDNNADIMGIRDALLK